VDETMAFPVAKTAAKKKAKKKGFGGNLGQLMSKGKKAPPMMGRGAPPAIGDELGGSKLPPFLQ
jgi:hypothetical protein